MGGRVQEYMIKFLSKTLTRLSGFLAISSLGLAAPAMATTTAPLPANEDAPAVAASATTDIVERVLPSTDEEAATAIGIPDSEFRNLFATWQSHDETQNGLVSIPSRMPVDNVVITSRFGYRTDPFKGRRKNHKGIDIAGPIGTPIYATADGIVGRAQWLGGYGRYVEIEHGGNIQTRYGHMSRLNVAPNQRVRRGDLIGFMGSTGRSTGSHLHYEVRINGDAVNPAPFMESTAYLVALEKRINNAQQVAVGGPSE
jgi:murein DD-endopeptidase MepM/ murein hydrolase activator NlpD